MNYLSLRNSRFLMLLFYLTISPYAFACDSEDLSTELRQAKWQTNTVNNFIQTNTEWLCLLKKNDAKRYQWLLVSLSGLNRPRGDTQRLIEDHPGIATLLVEMGENPTDFVRQIRKLAGSNINHQRTLIDLLNRQPTAQHVDRFIRQLSPQARTVKYFIKRGRVDIVSALAIDGVQDRRPTALALQSWLAGQANARKTDDDALDYVSWFRVYHMPKIEYLAANNRTSSDTLLKALNRLDPLNQQGNPFADESLGKSIGEVDPIKASLLANDNIWELVLQSQGLELAQRWGGLAAAALIGDASGKGYSEASSHVKRKIRDILRGNDKEVARTVIELRNTPSFHSILNKGIDDEVLRWVALMAFKPNAYDDGISIDHSFLAGLASMPVSAINHEATKTDLPMPLVIIPLANTAQNVWASWMYESSFDSDEVKELFEDIADVGLILATAGTGTALVATKAGAKTAFQLARTFRKARRLGNMVPVKFAIKGKSKTHFFTRNVVPNRDIIIGLEKYRYALLIKSAQLNRKLKKGLDKIFEGTRNRLSKNLNDAADQRASEAERKSALAKAMVSWNAELGATWGILRR